jgi:hypothetical protein
VRVTAQLSAPVTVPQFRPRRMQKAPSDSGVHTRQAVSLTVTLLAELKFCASVE